MHSLTDMDLLEAIEDRGWSSVPGVNGSSDLMRLAMSLGKPVENACHELISELRVAAVDKARPLTLSATFGTGPLAPGLFRCTLTLHFGQLQLGSSLCWQRETSDARPPFAQREES